MMSQQLAMDKIDYTRQESTSRKELDYAIQNIHSIISGEDDNLSPKKSDNLNQNFDDRIVNTN